MAVWRGRAGRGRWLDLPAPAVLALLYAGLILLGAALLLLPVSQRLPLTAGEALFTATSAVTVTGLVVVDTGTYLSHFGQGVLLALIQLGGLGLMTFAVLVLSALGMPVGLHHRVVLREDLNRTALGDLMDLVRVILRVVLLCELAGTAALSTVFVPEFGWAEGLWIALFHTVSAFNNAGFALWPDSLSRHVGDPVVNLVVPALFIFGGLGYSVVSEVWTKRRWRPLTLHSKLMLVGSAGLALGGWAMIAALEWSNPATLGPLDWHEKLMAGWFQSVTTRTAGFNTVDIAGLHDSTSLVMMSLMLIGGGSTSTAGGIKVTTFIVLLLATVAFFRRQGTLHAFGRSIGIEEVLKVLALVTLSLVTVLGGIFLVTLTHDGDFLDLAFEITSAFGTVGLSRGATAELDGLGRAVVIVVMFLGRVGPLTLGFFLATRSTGRVRYPASRVHLG